MSSHVLHDDIAIAPSESHRLPVLWDNCPRCDEHAADPFLGLDDGSLRQLYSLYFTIETSINSGRQWLTRNERQAGNLVGRAATRLDRLY